jgi:hypothetical protein
MESSPSSKAQSLGSSRIYQQSPAHLKLLALIEEDEMHGHVARMGTKRNAYRLFVGKPDGKVDTRRTKT